MSETNTPRITSEIKTKDPKKVEQGKRLTLISKEAKERKMRAKIGGEMRDQEESSKTFLKSVRAFCTSYIFPITALFACGTTLYFWRKSSNNNVNSSGENKISEIEVSQGITQEVKQVAPKETLKKSRFEEL